MPSNNAITLQDLCFSWPDGQHVLAGLNGAFSAGRTGLVGANGSGKSTLLRLIAGQLRPSGGRVGVDGEVAYLAQDLTLDVNASVADLLGVADKLAAIAAIEAGESDPVFFDVLADDWGVAARAQQALAQVGLPELAMDRRLGELSGGEGMLVALAGLITGQAPITLLDEPTNNLDQRARQAVYQVVRGWKRTLIVVSHDIDLLELMDNTAELYNQRLTVFGGPYSAWQQAVSAQQQTAVQAVQTARAALRVEKRQRQATEQALAHTAKKAKKDEANKRAPLIAMHSWAQDAQVSAGKLRGRMDDRVETARQALAEAEAQTRPDEHILIDLPDPKVPAKRRLAELHVAGQVTILQGPQRLAITGPNGAGKTTLLEQLVHDTAPLAGQPWGKLFTRRFGYLPQRADGLDPSSSAVDQVGRVAPHATQAELRGQLAKMYLRGDAALRPIKSLSGGERFRVVLATLILATPPAELLILDEPTNNLDLPSVTQLIDALNTYRGALIIVSHDEHFLEQLAPISRIELG
ncbi:MAG: ATP-binding cassette domain-containing protein [Propionibacteriaceae bacterium]|jgi:ATPase subunit of ABC transporter with duplicated ATPase domains|nr:ATP-binding cassette domain-containing protein [Propionibacteriaceae bacterium]